MKTVHFILLLIFPFLINAQEKDCTISHYGLMMDYKYSIGDAFGFKYKPSNTIAYFLKGGFSSEEGATRLSYGIDVSEITVYGGILGIEYTVLSMDNISFYTVISGGLNVHIRKNENNGWTRKTNSNQYTIETGLGAEYFISNHLSIGGSQIIAFSYFKDNIFDEHNKPKTVTQKKFYIGDAKLTLSFYF